MNGRADVFSAPAPVLKIDELATIAREQFGVDGVVSPLDSERDQNARIDARGQRFVLKVANVAEDPAALDLQIAVLGHLAAVAPELDVPRIVTAVDGTPYATVRSAQGEHRVRLVTYLPGRTLATVERTAELERDLGRFIGTLSRALQGFGHPAAHRSGFLWSLDHAQSIRPWADDIADDADRSLVEGVFTRHEHHVVPALPLLRGAVVHHDANDHNVLVDGGRVSGLIDFGDMVFARQVNELAVALAYALLDVPDIVATADWVIGAYTEQFALDELELSVLFDLVATRLAMSVAISSHRARQFPDNDYLLVSQAPALRLLRRLMSIRPQFLHFVARHAAGLRAVPQHDAIVAWLQSAQCRAVSPLPFDLRRAPRIVISLADGAPGMDVAGDPVVYWQWLQEQMTSEGAEVAIGRYAEDRNCYAGEQFTTDAPETRSVHLGIDLFVPEDTPVLAMLPGTVLTVQDNDAPYDYGPTVIIRHQAGASAGAPPFFVLYGHLSRRTLTTVRPGQQVAAGEVVGFIGGHTENGGWAPHVHVQVMTDLMVGDDGHPDGNFEGAGEPSRMGVWGQIATDADLLLRLGPETWTETSATGDAPDQLLPRRHRDLGPSLSVSYQRPLSIVRGEGTWLVDHTGRHYLDCVNNVCHVGHAHPHVVEALARQAARLNTNTRYLHRTILDYAERLAATFPDPLGVVYFVNSGSEANELALRMARTITGRHDVIAVDWGYHGNTNDLIEISAYKFNRTGGAGRPAHVQLAELPDTYRGRLRLDDANCDTLGAEYAASVGGAVSRLIEHDPRGPAAFIAESIAGCGGQVVFPPGYLDAAYRHARAAGALCIADEVQVGFGRVGRAMWAFQLQGVVPDIVTLGKPMGNGHPLAAVVTTPQIASAFANGMELFNTFGGNPVSCAVGMAVLDVIEREELIARAADSGDYLQRGLADLQRSHPSIGDVRGEGMYLGVDLVDDRVSRAPATALAGEVAERMLTRGVLISTDGPADNVLKIKPPIVFGRAEADVLLGELDRVLSGLRSPGPAPRRSHG